jgi:hypothetical protein
MTNCLCQLVYCLVVLHTMSSAPTFLSIDFSAKTTLDFLYPDQQLGISLLFALIPVLTILTAAWGTFKPSNFKTFLVFALYSTYIYLPFYVSGRIGHSQLTLIYSLLLLSFLSHDRPLCSKRNLSVLKIIQFSILSGYFSAGLWKVRTIISIGTLDSFESLPMQQIAYARAEGNSVPLFLMSIASAPAFPRFLAWGFVIVLLFQLTSFVGVIWPKFLRYFGFLALCFHVSTGLTMGVFFSTSAVVAFLFLTISELWLDQERNNLDRNFPFPES